MKERTQKMSPETKNIILCLIAFVIGGMVLFGSIPAITEQNAQSAEEYFEDHGSYPALLCQIVCAWFILQAFAMLIMVFGILVKEKWELQNDS